MDWGWNSDNNLERFLLYYKTYKMHAKLSSKPTKQLLFTDIFPLKNDKWCLFSNMIYGVNDVCENNRITWLKPLGRPDRRIYVHKKWGLGLAVHLPHCTRRVFMESRDLNLTSVVQLLAVCLRKLLSISAFCCQTDNMNMEIVSL